MMLSMPGGFFSEPVGVPIYDFFLKGGQICRITESHKMLNIRRENKWVPDGNFRCNM